MESSLKNKQYLQNKNIVKHDEVVCNKNVKKMMIKHIKEKHFK